MVGVKQTIVQLTSGAGEEDEHLQVNTLVVGLADILSAKS